SSDLRAVRRLGWVLVVIGTALVGFMGWLSFVVGEIVYRTREGLPGTATFTGDAEDLALITGAFGLVIAIGVGAVFGGAWQIRYGRPNRKVMAVAVFLVSLMLHARPIQRMLNASCPPRGGRSPRCAPAYRRLGRRIWFVTSGGADAPLCALTAILIPP